MTSPFEPPDRIPLALLPTPIHRLDRLSKAWNAEIWIKRDDLTGAALSGNKIRKLEFVLAEARRRGLDAVVTCGGVQSNHCRATAIACRRLGLTPHLVLRTPDGKAPAEVDGNLLLDRLAGAEITWITPDDYRERRGTIMERIALEKNALVIPEGASDARGALGYVAAVAEIVKQVADGGLPAFEYIAHACGSGGTSAGLAIGNELSSAFMMPVAFAVCDDEAYFRGVTKSIFDGFRQFAKLESDPPLTIIDRHKGIGYAQSTPEELAFLASVVREEGIVLDPVYSGKAFLGLKKELEAGGTFRKGGPILFLHTGGIYGLFPKRAEIAAVTPSGA